MARIKGRPVRGAHVDQAHDHHPDWLARLRAALERAVWAAYGWDNDPAEEKDEAIPAGLVELNWTRATR